MKNFTVIVGCLFAAAAVLGTTPAPAQTVEEDAKLLPSDGSNALMFGRGVAVDGDTAVIGAIGDDSNGASAGAAYVFTRTAGVWSEQVKLLPSDGAAGDHFGRTLALDGDTAVISSVGDDDNGDGSGSVYVFTRSAGIWSEQAKLLPSDGIILDNFGYSIALDGDTVLIGSYRYLPGPPAAYVFVRTGNVWTQQAKLTPADGQQNFFGWEVALHGETAIIGAPGDSDTGSYAGAAYVFVRTGNGWTQHAKLTPADAEPNDNFGEVALDGDRAVIGAPGDDDHGEDSGSAYVFTRIAGVWSEQAKLLAFDGSVDDVFGRFIEVDGNTTVIGAYGSDVHGSASGAAYVFRQTSGGWVQQAKLAPSDGAPNDLFSFEAVDFEGGTAIIGAFPHDGNAFESGAAWVFGIAECGNGSLEPDGGEECDDSNTLSCDGCSEFCEIEVGYICGDGTLNPDCGEECDDGNNIDGDGCAADCTDEIDVPATSGLGVLLLVLALGGSAMYFVRRRSRGHSAFLHQ